jgi:hypothetical protein
LSLPVLLSLKQVPVTRQPRKRMSKDIFRSLNQTTLMVSMSQGIQQMTHEQYVKHQDELPAGYEAKMNAMMDDMFQNMPLDEMMDSMVPAYQKHFTEGDINNLIAFYSSPTGAKLLRELPEIMAESMQDMMPVMTKYLETIQTRLKKETDTMIAQSKKPANKETTATHN